MIDPETSKAVYLLHQQGMTLRQISRSLSIGRKAIRRIIQHQGVLPSPEPPNKIHIERELLERLYRECQGRIKRIHEKLVEEENVKVSYSTICRMLEKLEISKPTQTRCDRVPDVPGEEMQHDTTIYRVSVGGLSLRLICSLVYLRYSKRRYLKFYPVFNRFLMKCFLHEALTFWTFSANRCIIDNTNLARLRGTGSRAVIVAEMVAFGKRYGFQFACHAINHPNRKAGNERGFYTVETNFLPGRQFESLEDLNRQAFEWATVRMEHRPVSKTGLIPAKAFEQEQHYLTPVSSALTPPYLTHERQVDQYGYAALNGNYYWVPGVKRGTVKVLEFAERLKIYRHRQCVAEYPLPAVGVKNASFSPEGEPKSRYQPKARKRDSKQEETRLRAMGPEVSAYVDYILQAPGIQRHHFLRKLFAFSGKVIMPVFIETTQRALRYRILDMETVERIAWLCTSQGDQQVLDVEVDESYHERPAYQEGCLTDEPDLSIYDEMLEEDDETDNPENDPSDDEGQPV